MRKRAAGAAALAGSLALVCSACGGASPSAASHKDHHAPPPSTSTTTAPPPASTTSTTAAAASTTRCTFADLTISVGQSGAGLGHEGGVILFENTGTSACTLSGYPGVAALNSSGTQVQQARRTPSGYLGGMQTGSTTPPVVTLQVGGTASAFVEGTDVPVGTATSCPTYAGLLVTPPTATQSTRLTLSLPGCSPIQVHPVVSGTTGTTQ